MPTLYTNTLSNWSMDIDYADLVTKSRKSNNKKFGKDIYHLIV